MALTAWPKNIQYQATNVAFFMENMFQFKRLLIIPGIRFEKVNGKASGINGFDIAGLPIKLQEQQRSRAFFLMGLGAEYQINKMIECYGNFTQAYRPMQFSDLTATATNDKIDPALKDASGFNTDIGIRGKIKNYLSFDISLYHLQYNRRIGSITQQNVDGSFYSFRTNVGDSRSDGIESFAEYNLTKCFFPQKKNSELLLHAAYNYNHSRYGNFKTIVNVNNVLVEKNFIDKKVENAPSHLLRSGITYFYKSFSIGAQYSYVSEVYSDANNTLIPTANGQNGLIPSYQIVDMHATYSYKNIYHIKLGLNNLTNEKYFTRRSGGYPGPGLLPAEGRSFFATLGIKF